MTEEEKKTKLTKAVVAPRSHQTAAKSGPPKTTPAPPGGAGDGPKEKTGGAGDGPKEKTGGAGDGPKEKTGGDTPPQESKKDPQKDPQKDPEKDSEKDPKRVPKYVKPYKSSLGGKRSMPRRVVPWAAAALLIAAFAGLTLFRQSEPEQVVVVGPAVGGPFTLTDSFGRTVSDTDFRGRFMLIYFGYTYCPDICPTSLSAIADTLDRLGEDGDKVAPLFITIDPDRDTPEQLKEYISFFHPRQVALTGTADQIAAVAKSYGIFYTKDPAPDDGHSHDHDDYDMTHASAIFLMGPDGKYRAHFRHDATIRDMAERIRKFL